MRFLLILVTSLTVAADAVAQGNRGVREFFDAYAAALREHRRDALAGFYHRDGALVVFNGTRIPNTAAQLDSYYRGPWQGPAFFAWDSLQFQNLAGNQVLATGGFRWLQAQSADTLRFIYLAILDRTPEGLKIRVEHETQRPPSP